MSPELVTPLEQELRLLHDAFTEARALLRQGATIDLTGMDDRVKEFCEHVQAAEPDLRIKIEPDFVALLTLLDELERELRRVNDNTQGKPPGANDPHE